MKKIFTIILIIVCSHAFAQDSLKFYNNNRNHITGSGMEVLGGWGILNLGGGAVGWSSSTDPTSRYFYQMNVIWGAADFGAALITFTGTQKYKNRKLTAAESIEAQNRIEKIFMINEGLDVVYLGAGAYLTIEGHSRNSPIMKGYGSAVLLQGSFLLVFDALMHHAEKQNGSKLRNFLEKHPVTFNGKQVGILFNM